MGTDIHIVMEWLDGREWRPFNPDPDPEGPWDSYGKMTPHPSAMEQLASELGLQGESRAVYVWSYSRDYSAFRQLAGVRGDEGQLWECAGLPEFCSREAWEMFNHRLSDETNWENNTVTLEYIERIRSKRAVVDRFGDKWVRNVDLHTPGCIYLHSIDSTPGITKSLAKLIKYCKSLAETRNIPFDKIRMTFAFDN